MASLLFAYKWNQLKQNGSELKSQFKELPKE
jgi:hypothetical protein